MNAGKEITTVAAASGNNGESELLLLDNAADALITEDARGAIQTLSLVITSLAGQGEDGLRALNLLLEMVGEAVFSTGERALVRRQEASENLPVVLITFATRNVEVLARALDDGRAEQIPSALRYLLSEASEEMVIAHALASLDVMRSSSGAHLRDRGYKCYEVCLEVAAKRGFGARVQKVFEDADGEEDGGNNDNTDRDAAAITG